MKNAKSRLFIGKFTGDTLIYKHKQTSQAVALKQSGILDLKVEYIFDDVEFPQFIVGSSDRCLSIFDYSGDIIWAFESGLGQRAIDINKIADGELEIFVGTESGDVFSYSVEIVKDLVLKIKNSYENSGITDLMDLKIESNKLKILRNYIEYNPIKYNASLDCIKNLDDFQNRIISMMEVWFNNCEFVWEYKTNGRIYDLSYILLDDRKACLVGSDDGTLYCLGYDGQLKWYFNSQHDLRDMTQGIRGVFAHKDSIFTVSSDNSIYKLNCNGIPEWNFCHNDWILYVASGSFNGADKINIFAGTEDGYVLFFDEDGLLLWKQKLKKRVRALSFCENYNGKSYVIAGCDDNEVYIIDKDGEIINHFMTPHYVLVVKAYDIDEDGKIEILTGNENGHLHVYDFNGTLLWRFETDSWVAALDVFKNKENAEVEIVIGSQDNNVYVLNKYGALLWQYEANARVRTIAADGESNMIAFGSYDNSAYMLKQVNREVILESLYDLYIEHDLATQIQQLVLSGNRYFRAFAYLFTENIEILKNGLSDKSDIVIAAIGNNLIENFLPNNECEDIFADLLVNANRRVKAVVLCKLTKAMRERKIRKILVAQILSDAIIRTELTTDKIDIFRYWLTITDNCDDIIRLIECLIPSKFNIIDEFLIDEINRACLIAISKSNGDSGDYTIVAKSEKISSLIKEKYPDTANQLKKIF